MYTALHPPEVDFFEANATCGDKFLFIRCLAGYVVATGRAFVEEGALQTFRQLPPDDGCIDSGRLCQLLPKPAG